MSNPLITLEQAEFSEYSDLFFLKRVTIKKHSSTVKTVSKRNVSTYLTEMSVRGCLRVCEYACVCVDISRRPLTAIDGGSVEDDLHAVVVSEE